MWCLEMTPAWFSQGNQRLWAQKDAHQSEGSTADLWLGFRFHFDSPTEFQAGVGVRGMEGQQKGKREGPGRKRRTEVRKEGGRRERDAAVAVCCRQTSGKGTL